MTASWFELIGEAKKKFHELELPSERSEQWRYTNIRNIPVAQLLESSVGKQTWSASDGILVLQLEKAVEKKESLLKSEFLDIQPQDKIDYMHLGFWKSGLFVLVPKGIHGRLTLEQAPSLVRNVIILKEGSSLEIFEEISGAGFNSSLTQVHVGDGASLDYQYLQNTDESSIDFSSKIITAGKDAKIKTVVGSFGSKLSRTDLIVHLHGEGASAKNYAMFFGNGRQHIDNSILVTHTVPNTNNVVITKGIMTDHSTSVVKGLIDISKGAKKTNSSLDSRSLILSEHAVANSIPSLEINEHDVICKHAQATGKIDDEQLFYLMTRGVSQKEAEHLIIEGYLEPLVEQVSPAHQEKFRSIIASRWV